MSLKIIQMTQKKQIWCQKNLKTLLVNSSLGLSGVLLHPASSNSFITSYFERFSQIIEAKYDIWFQFVLERNKDIEKYDAHTEVLEVHLLHSILFILVEQHFHLNNYAFIKFQEWKKISLPSNSFHRRCPSPRSWLEGRPQESYLSLPSNTNWFFSVILLWE